jgi:hypothetical protein
MFEEPFDALAVKFDPLAAGTVDQGLALLAVNLLVFPLIAWEIQPSQQRGGDQLVQYAPDRGEAQG